MHPETSMATRDGLVYVTLSASKLLDRLHRKIRRSKKLTRLFLGESAWLELTSHTAAMKQGACTMATLAEPAELPPPGKLVCVGPPLIRMALPQDPPQFPAIRVIRLNQVRVFGHSSMVQTRHGQLVHHDLFNPTSHRLSEEDHHRLRIDPLRGKAQMIGAPMQTIALKSAAAFTDSVSSNYAHWLTEVLPRIALYVQAPVSGKKPLIVDAGLHPNLYESLSAVAGHDRTVYLLPRDRRVFVDELDVVTPAGYVPHSVRPPKQPGHSHGVFCAKAVWAVRNACQHLMWPVKKREGLRLYVRRNSGVRKLVNDQEISDALAACGFTVVSPEALTFSEQVRLFSQAELVIGATGAAMANLIFCPQGSRVCVLMAQHEDMPYWYWQRMADCIGVQLSYGLGEICAEHDKGFHADFRVEVRDVMAAIHEAPHTPMAQRSASS